MASILGVETLQHPNGTTAATIDSSGNLTVPNLIATPSTGEIIQSVYSPFNAARKSFNNSGAYVATGHSVTITPKYSNSMIELALNAVTNTGGNNMQIQFYETTSSPTAIGSRSYTGDHSGWRTVSQMTQIASTGTSARTFEVYVKSANAIYSIETGTTTAPANGGAAIVAREIAG